MKRNLLLISLSVLLLLVSGHLGAQNCTPDVTPPLASCQNITVYLDATGNVTITAADIDGGSSDSCSGVTLSIPPTSFTCADAGPNNVTMTVTDAAGNSTNCMAIVTVIDTLLPTVVCKDTTVYLDATGSITIAASALDGGSSDGCPGLVFTASQTTFTCADTGANTVTLYVTDGSGNVDSCTSTVTILDTVPPAVVCNDTTVYLDASGNASIVASDIDGGTADACGGVITLTASMTSFDCDDIGANNVTLYAQDENGNIDSCTAVVTVLDTTSPTVVCQDITVYLDAAGSVTIDSNAVDNGSSDNCDIMSFATSMTTFTCTDTGANTVTLTVTDSSGNTNTCTSVVTVLDTTSPIANCIDTTIYLDATGSVTIDSSYINNGSTDNCGIVTIVPSVSTFSCTDTGANTVTLTVTDGSGNVSTCTATVTVLDTIAPMAVCIDTTIYLDGSGSFTIDSSFIDATVENCSYTATLSATTFDCDSIGARSVSLFVEDASGNRDTCVATVTVLDTTSPTVVCQDITVYLDAAGSVTIDSNAVDNGSSDNCDIMSFATSMTTFTCTDTGANTVTLTVTDSSGNTNTCTSVVTVLDTTSPIANCIDTTIYLDATGSVTIDSSYINNGSTDNCGIVTIVPSVSTFSCTDTGANTVTLTVTDGSGNVSTCTATVTVLDTIAPMAVCIDTTIYLDGSGSFTIDSSFIDATVENCSYTATLSATTFDCDSIGARSVSLFVEDASGNRDTCVATVTVLDTTPPVALCKDTTIYLDALGNVTILPVGLNNGSFDNCNSVTITSSATIFTCDSVGVRTVYLYVEDASGNMDTCTSLVTVLDTIPPVAVCMDTTIYLDASGSFTIDSSFIENGSSDNCSIETITLSAYTYTCDSVGARTVSMYVTDSSGNVDTCTATVTVLDTIAPMAVCIDTTIYLDATGSFTIDSSFIDGTIENCSYTATLSSTTFTCDSIGARLVSLLVVDASGNRDSCVATVTVLDTLAPMAMCTDTTIYLDATGSFTIDSSFIDNGSSDNCGIQSMVPSSTVFTCDSVGVRTVTLTVTDSSGNVATCTSLVTVLDTLAPMAMCTDTTIYLDATGSFTIDSTFIDNGSSDNCSFTATLSATTFTCDSVGPRTVTLLIVDASGNRDSCTSTVTVLDTTPPVALCQDTTVYLDATGNVTIDSTFIDNGTFDNCAFTTSISSTMFTCDSVGARTVYLYAEDASGNRDTCSSIVTVLDTINPTITCRNVTLFLDSMGNSSIVLSDVLTGSADNCAVDTVYVSQDTFTCDDLGTNNVSVIAVDASGNVDSCISIVTVFDVINPNALCKDDTVYLDATGNGSNTAADIDNGSSDNCAITLSLSDSTYTCADIGANAVSLYVRDISGNLSVCTSTVTVLDTVAPTVSCNNPTVYLNGLGTASISVSDIDNGSTDNCAIASTTISNNSFDCSNIGANSVTLIVTDASGNVDSCVATVTVADTISPVASCQNVTVYLDSMGNGSIDSTDVNNGSTDNCGIATISISDATFTCSDIGSNTVTVTVTDASGNSSTCSSVVTVVDNFNPTAVCKDDTVYLDATGNIIITSANVDGGSSDNCSFTMTLSDSTFNCADTGANTVTLYVTDSSGNLSVCTSTITVYDTTAPMVMCKNDTVYLDASGNVTISVSDVDNGTVDNCSLASMTLSQTNFNCSNIGTNMVTLTARDLSGNVDSCTATITILDTIPPVAACQNATIYLDSMGNASLDTASVNSGSTDNCAIASITISNASFDCTNIGTNVVTVTVTDASGNIDSCTSIITVVDNISPTAVCKDDTVYLDATGNIVISTANVDGGSSDNCSPITMTISDSLFTCTDTGANTVTLYVTDAAGNLSLCTSTVNVKDTMAPNAICLSPTVYLDAFGNASITVSDIDGGSTDNCSIASRTISRSSFNCSNLGANFVTLIVTDVSGNIDSCISTVNVVDTIRPVANCKNATIYLNASGTVVLTSLDVDNGSTDNCNVTTITLSQTVFTCSEVGPNNVTVTVTDPSGNVDSCVAVVTVLDTVPPTAICQNITIQLDSNGDAFITAFDVDGGSTDNCAVASLVVNQTSFDCSHLGMNTVVLTVTDIYGNSSTCTATVTVEDNISPITYCPSDKQIVVRNTMCSYILPDYTGEASAWDNCLGNGVTITQTPAAGSEVFLENTDTTITLTATDGSGNISTCSFQLYARCVKELNIPQFFSPDGNGQNDTWEIPELANYPNNTVKVFNRWGNLVFEQKGYYTGWDGRANADAGVNRLVDNKMLPEGTYYYIIDLGEDSSIEPYVGYMQLKR